MVNMYRFLLSAIVLPFCLIFSGLPIGHAETPAVSSESGLKVFPSPKDQQILIDPGSKIELYFWPHDPKSEISDSQAEGIVKVVGDLPDGAAFTKEFENEEGYRYLLSWTPTESQAAKEYSVTLVASEKNASSEGTSETMVIRVASAEPARSVPIVSTIIFSQSNRTSANVVSDANQIEPAAVGETDSSSAEEPSGDDIPLEFKWVRFRDITSYPITDTTAQINAFLDGQPADSLTATVKIISGPSAGEVTMTKGSCGIDLVLCAKVWGTFQNLTPGSDYQYQIEVYDTSGILRATSTVSSFTTYSTGIDGLRAALLDKITREEENAHQQILNMEDWQEQWNDEAERVRKESTDLGNKIRGLFALCDKVLNNPDVEAEVKTAIQDYMNRMNHYLDPANADGLSQKTEAYIVDLTEEILAHIAGEIAGWNEYLVYLADYRNRVTAASTLEELMALDENFAVRVGSTPMPTTLNLPDPKEEAERYYREGKNLIWKAADADLESIVAVDADSNQTITLLVERNAVQPNELAVLVNDNDPQSVAVATYYQAVRKIPEKNMIHVNIPVFFRLTEAEFNAMKAQIEAAIDPNIQGFVVTWTQPWKVGEQWSNYGMSITSALALGFSAEYLNNTPSACNAPHNINYYDSDSNKPFVDHDIRPAMMLGGYTVQDVFALIDRGALAAQNFPEGDGYFIRTTDWMRSGRFGFFKSTVNQWSPTPLKLYYIDNDKGSTANDYIQNKSNVLFYLTGLTSVPQIDTNQYVPGAITDHLTSYGGILLGESGQMSALKWLKAGATASYGTVSEPCATTQKFPNPEVLVPSYLSGQTALEAYWKSVQAPGEGVFVGDPLARPYGTKATLKNDVLQIKTTILNPGTKYALASADSKNGPFTTIQSDISVDKLGFTTLDVPQAGKPYYKLVNANLLPDGTEALRAELLDKIAAEETAANTALTDLNQQLIQLQAELDVQAQTIRTESKIWGNRIKVIVSALEKAVIKLGVTEKTKTDIRNYIDRMNQYLNPANANGLERQTEAYIAVLTGGQLAPLNAQIGSWNQYLSDLQIYRDKVVAATTLAELQVLAQNFPLKVEFPVPGMPFFPDPRIEARQFFFEGTALLKKANMEAVTLPDPRVVRLTDTIVQIEIEVGLPEGNRLILNVLDAGLTGMSTVCSGCEGDCEVFTGAMDALKPGVMYQYFVQMVDPQGNVVAKSRTLSFTTESIIAPLSDPEVVRLTETTVHVQINTTVDSGNTLFLRILNGAKAQMYEILCNCEGCGAYAGDINELKPDTTYQYWVEMVDPQGNVVAKSRVLSFTTNSHIIINADESRVIEEGLGLNIKLDPKFKAVSIPPNATFGANGTFYLLPNMGDRSTYIADFSMTDDGGKQLMRKKIGIEVIAKNTDVIPTHHDQFPNLASNPSVIATKSGNWSDPDIWSKAIVPVDGDTVRIPPGIEVVYDVISDAELNAIGLNGHLKFATSKNTKLKVGDLIVFSDGHLEIGSETNPMQDQVKADIVITDKALDVGTSVQPGRDPKQYGTGINVFGKMETHGAPKNLTWVRLAQEIKAGDRQIMLSEPVTGWKAGDTIVIPDSRQVPLVNGDHFRRGTFPQQWEERVIEGIENDKVILTQAVSFDHLGARDTSGALKFLPHVALLDRNVIIHSEPLDPADSEDRYCESQELSSVGCKTRGHMLFTDRADTDIRYTRFQDLGRTDSFKRLDNTRKEADNTTHIGTNQIARYAIHWHHCMGPRREGADRYDPEVYQYKFIGNTVDRATKWAVTIHGTSFGLMTDNVVYRAQGAGIVTEEGDEVGNKIMRNFVMRMQGTGHDGRDGIEEADYKSGNYGNGGSGFWFRRSGNIVRDNVAVNNRWGAYVYTSYYLASLDELKEKMIITPRFRGANRMNDMHQPDEGDYLLINPNGEFSGNEAYGLTLLGLWLAYIRGFEIHPNLIKDIDMNPANGLQPMEPIVFEHSNFWHLRTGVVAWHTTRLTYDHLTFLSDKNAVKDYPTDGNVAFALYTYENWQTRITNTHIEGFKAGIVPSLADRSKMGDKIEDSETIGEVIENCFLKNFINISISPLRQPRGALTIKNVRFDNFKIISSQGTEERWWIGGARVNLPGDPRHGTPITYGPLNILMNMHLADGSRPGDNDSAPINLAARRIVRVLDYNGVSGDNFEVFFKDQAPEAIIPKSQFNRGHRFSTKFLGAPEEGLTNAQSFQKHGIAVGGAPVPPCASNPRPEIDAITCNLAPGQWTNVPTLPSPRFYFSSPWENDGVITHVESYMPLPFHYVVSEGFSSDARIFFQLDARTPIREHGEGDLFFSGVTPGTHTLTGWVTDANKTEVPGSRRTVTFQYE